MSNHYPNQQDWTLLVYIHCKLSLFFVQPYLLQFSNSQNLKQNESQFLSLSPSTSRYLLVSPLKRDNLLYTLHTSKHCVVFLVEGPSRQALSLGLGRSSGLSLNQKHVLTFDSYFFFVYKYHEPTFRHNECTTGIISSRNNVELTICVANLFCCSEAECHYNTCNHEHVVYLRNINLPFILGRSVQHLNSWKAA